LQIQQKTFIKASKIVLFSRIFSPNYTKVMIKPNLKVLHIFLFSELVRMHKNDEDLGE